MANPATRYVQITGGKITTAQTGTPQFEISMLVLNKLENNQWVALQPPIERTMYFSLSEKAYEHTVAKLKTLGFNGDVRNPKFSDEVMSEGLYVYGYTDTYEGKQTEKYDLCRWGDRKENEPAGDDVLLSFETRWKSTNAPKPPVPGGRPATPPARNAAPAVPAATTARRAAPPPAAAAPSATAPAAGTGTSVMEMDRDGCWEKFCHVCEERGVEPGVDVWGKIISEVARKAGKAEAQFATAEWEQVAAAIDIPF